MNLTSLALLLLALICSPVASYAGNKCNPNGMSESMWEEGPDQFDVYQSARGLRMKLLQPGARRRQKRFPAPSRAEKLEL